MKKITKMNESAWVLGTILCALGVALTTKANFGLSMVAAPSYIVYVKLSQIFDWYSQGTGEYIFQGFLLLIMCVAVRRFKWKYFLSFATAVIFGLALDGWLYILGGNGAYESMTVRIVIFVISELVTALSIALYFRTSLPLQMYELFVSECARRFHADKNRVKLIYDVSSLVISGLLAWLLNRSFSGIGIGTVIITCVNAPLIGMLGKLLDRVFVFDEKLPRFTSVLRIN